MTELATQGSTELAPLYSRPQASADLDASDIQLPKLKIGQSMTPQVQEGLVHLGDLFTHTTADDADVVRVAPDKDGVPLSDGLEFYVLGVRKGWSLQADGELTTWAFDDPSRPEKAYKTYTYTVAIPEVDEQLPFNLLLTKTSAPAAKQINLLLKRYATDGDDSQLALVLGSKKKVDSAKGYSWFVAQVTTAPEPTDAKGRKAREAAQATAKALAGLVQSAPAASTAAADDGQPSI